MELVLDHSGSPRNYGVLELADITQEGGNPGCGDIIKIYLTVDTVLDILGKKLVSTRPRCAMLGFNTVKNAIKEYKKQEMLSSI